MAQSASGSDPVDSGYWFYVTTWGYPGNTTVWPAVGLANDPLQYISASRLATYRKSGGAITRAAYYFQGSRDQNMSFSQKGLAFIERHEGYSDKIYLDSAGNPTIGYGHLIKEGEDFSKGITKEKAAELLSQDTKIAVDAVNRLVTATLSQTQFDALVDFTYNLGAGSLGKSTLLTNINAGLDVVEENFTDWNHAGGKVVEGLTIRRTDEWNLFSNGNYGVP